MPDFTLRKSLDRQIGKLLDDLLVLGNLVSAATLQAVEALRKWPPDRAGPLNGTNNVKSVRPPYPILPVM